MLHHQLKKFIDNSFTENETRDSFLVVGAPGTGKTFQLIKLIEYLVINRKVNPEKILVFSFNRRWAKILRDKTAEAIHNSFFEIPVTTFFAFCTELIEKEKYFDRQPVILNAPAQWKLLSKIMQGITDKKNYPTTKRLMESSSFVVKNYIQEVFDFILRSQENLITPENFLAKLNQNSDPQLYELGGIYLKYLNSLEEGGLYNYGRLLTDALKILSTAINRNTEYAHSYDAVIVDELQETNRAQIEIVKRVSKNTKCIYFGNDDECTYAFRGSLINNFSRIYGHISSLSKDNILHLQTNYRNSRVINDICRDFISLNEDRIDKISEGIRKKTAKETNDDEPAPVIKEFRDSLQEASFICEYIKKLIILKKVRAENICILIKGLGYKTGILENILAGNNILFSRRGSRTILDNKYVKYMLDFSRLVSSMEVGQDTSIQFIKTSEPEEDNMMQGLLSSEITGISSTFIKRLSTGCKNLLQSIIDIVSISLNKDLQNIKDKKKSSCPENMQEMHVLKNEDVKKIENFINMIKIFLSFKNIPAFNFFIMLLYDKDNGIIRNLICDKKIPDLEKEGTSNVIGDFLQSVKVFCQDNPGKNSIMDYLDFLGDIQESGFLEEIEASTKDSVNTGHINIMSYHQCKGMEFDAVFMPFINKDYLPSVFKGNQLYDMQIFNYFAEGRTLPEKILRKRHFEDERKLFYTGISRAKKFLVITSSLNEGKSAFFEQTKSIFTLNNIKRLRVRDKESISQKQVLRPCEKKQESKKEQQMITLIDQHPWLMHEYLVRKIAVSLTSRLFTGRPVNFNFFIKKLIYLKYLYPPVKWWGIQQVTLNKKNPANFYRNTFSYTSLSTFIECPQKYKYRFFFNLEEPENLYTKIGSIYHKILKEFYEESDKGLSWDRLEDITVGVFKSNEFAFPYLYHELLNKALSGLKNYYNKYGTVKIQGVIMEKFFNFNLNGKQIKGRIDQIRVTGKHTAELIDFKSGRKSSAYSDPESEIQLPLYKLAIEKSSDLKLLTGMDLVLKYIFLGDEDCAEAVFPHKTFDFYSFEKKLLSLIKKIENEQFNHGPQSYYVCKNCQFRQICKITNAKRN